MTDGTGQDFSKTAEGGEDYALSLSAALRPLRRWWWVVLLSAVLCAAAVLVYSLLQTPRYEASIKLLIAEEEGGSGPPPDLPGLASTMAEAVNSKPVAQAVVRDLDLSEDADFVLANLSAEPIPETQFVRVSYTDADPETSRRVADAIGEEFSGQVADVSPSANVTATVWEGASTPESPASPRSARNALLALMLGAMLGVGLAFLLGYLDDRCRTPEEAERASGVHTFGVIPDGENDSRRPTILTESSPNDSAVGEAYRSLRAGLLYSNSAQPRVIMVAGLAPDGGGAEVCANLGVVMAQAERRTLIVDCDFRSPTLAGLFDTEDTSGLADLLAGEAGTRHKLRPNLGLISAGRVPSDPTELLSSEYFVDFLGRMRDEFDYVFLSTPPVLSVSDPAIVAALADGVLLVLDARHTRKATVRQGAQLLRDFGASILGTVTTGAKSPVESGSVKARTKAPGNARKPVGKGR